MVTIEEVKTSRQIRQFINYPLKLYKGNIIKAGVWSDYTLYSEEIATFGASDYNQQDAAGFINLYGLPIRVKALVDKKNGKK